jgi:alpha-tubulin suppressor-like RCC1 family protein
MIGTKDLIDNANDKIDAGNLTELEILQLSSITPILENNIITVGSLTDLPDASENTGRLLYVTSTDSYYFSDGISWSRDFSTSFIDTGGQLYAWGDNRGGELGDGTTTYRSSPITVVGGIMDWSKIAAGGEHNLALRNNGVLYAWGDNFAGRLGDGTSTGKSSPVTVVGGITNWSQISASGAHSLAIRVTRKTL